MDNRSDTIFCDLDGTLVKKVCPSEACKYTTKLILLPGVKQKLLEWDRKGCIIILTTGRKESMRKTTEHQLAEAGIFYDQLIMGIGGGVRYIINDYKPNNSEPTAIAIIIKRDEGLNDLL